MAKKISRYANVATTARALSQLAGRVTKSGGNRTRRRMRTAFRSRFRGTGSRTITKTQRRRRPRAPQTSIDTSSVGGFVYSNGRKRRLDKGKESAIYHLTYGYRITATAGKQVVDDTHKLYDFAALNPQFQNVPNFVNYLSAGNHTFKLVTRGCRSKMMITNQHQSPVKVQIYDLICRKDCDNISDYPTLAMDTGIKEQSINTMDKTTLGIQPMRSQQFNVFWKIAKVKTAFIDPGAVHLHYVTARVNKAIPYSYMAKSSDSYYRGITYATLIVAHGLPINDLDTKTQVSTAAVALDIVVTTTYMYTYTVPDNKNATAFASLGTIATEHGIEVMDGAVVDLLSA